MPDPTSMPFPPSSPAHPYVLLPPSCTCYVGHERGKYLLSSDPATAVTLYNIEWNGGRGGGCLSDFRPNLTPKQVMQMGSFGGTYFRPIKSSITNMSYKDVWKEFPAGNSSHHYAEIRFPSSCSRYSWISQTWRLVFSHLSVRRTCPLQQSD